MDSTKVFTSLQSEHKNALIYNYKTAIPTVTCTARRQQRGLARTALTWFVRVA